MQPLCRRPGEHRAERAFDQRAEAALQRVDNPAVSGEVPPVEGDRADLIRGVVEELDQIPEQRRGLPAAVTGGEDPQRGGQDRLLVVG